MASYHESRAAFLALGKALTNYSVQHSATVVPYVGPTGTVLSTDYLRIASGVPLKWLVLTSGIHGPELFVGSRIQQALLTGLKQESLSLPADIGLLLVHSVNPFGAAWLRRHNINNVDLNRNFMVNPEEVLRAEETNTDLQAALKLYKTLYSFINPATLPKSKVLDSLHMLWFIRKHSLNSLKAAVGVGQREFPRGLQYAGTVTELENEQLEVQLNSLLPEAAQVVCHVDLHSGLGDYGKDILITADLETYECYRNLFGEPRTTCEEKNPVFSKACNRFLIGELGSALKISGKYLGTVQEFGTFKPTEVFAALRNEMVWHNQNLWIEDFARGQTTLSDKHPDQYLSHSVKAQMLRAFYPDDEAWRKSTLELGLEVYQKTIQFLSQA